MTRTQAEALLADFEQLEERVAVLQQELAEHGEKIDLLAQVIEHIYTS